MDATQTADALRATADRGERLPGVVVLFTEGRLPRAAAVPVTGPTTLGRLPERDIHVDDPSLSRAHAVFRRSGGFLEVEDRGSHNGTFANGLPVPGAARLRPGDVVRAGGTVLLAVGDVRAFAGWPACARVPPLSGGPALAAVRRAVAAVAREGVPVILVGETGTGKGVAARAIHDRSGRPGPFVSVNCAAIPDPLFEAELFGACRGAFTGAVADRPGLLRAAHGGTVFLDEVADLPLSQQAKLLTAIEERVVRPLGSARPVKLDVRFIAAASESLDRAVAEGRFRRDLFYRLRGVQIALPPLRERREDVALIGLDTLQELTAPLPATAAFVERLLLHDWPGNVRELQQAVKGAAVAAGMAGAAAIGAEHLPLPPAAAQGVREVPMIDRIRAALTRTGGNVSRAAAELGIRRERVYDALRKHDLKAADFR